MKNEKQLFLEKIINTWVDPNEDESIVNKRFDYLNEKSSLIYDFVFSYTNYMMKKRDYGTGEELSMIEAHILTDIADNEGITVTFLSKKWKKTKSAISQTVKSLINKNYVYKVVSKEDAKFYYLYPTEKAKKFALAHKRYDNVDIVKTNKTLFKKFSIEELIIFNKILEEYTKILNSKEDK